jgi:hypothetical protein
MEKELANQEQKEITGSNVNYYLIDVSHPKRLEPYVAEVEDIIESLDMNFAEGTILKSLVRLCKLKQNFGKPGSSRLYEAQKIKYYADRILAQAQQDKDK